MHFTGYCFWTIHLVGRTLAPFYLAQYINRPQQSIHQYLSQVSFYFEQ